MSNIVNKMVIVDEEGNQKEISMEEYKQRKLLVISMNNIMNMMNDEYAYMDWICTVPDEATEEDLEYIACDDELFKDTCRYFRSIIKEYGKSGFYVGGVKSW